MTLSLSGKFQRVEATVIGVERQADLALLKINGHQLPTLSFNVKPPQPGQIVVAIGSPSGLQNSVTMGVISSAWRQPDPDNPMVYLQTDAPINRGNSGGPLVDVSGAVVGLNTFIISSSGGSEGLGFAIPARVMDFVYRSLREYGRVEHVDIGVVAQTVTAPIAEGLALSQHWVVVGRARGFNTVDTGLEPGDVISSLNRTSIGSVADLRTAVARLKHGDPVVLRIEHLGRSRYLTFEME